MSSATTSLSGNRVLNPPEERQNEHVRTNVGDTERWVSVVGGAALSALGLKQKSLGGLVVAAMGGSLLYRGVTGHCHGYKLLGINTSNAQATPQDYYEDGVHVEQSFTIQRDPAELYNYWRNFQNLPSFMAHLEKVEVLDDKRSRWTAKAPAGRTVTWEAEIINEEPNRLIAWRSLANADVNNTGSVRFVPAPGGRGTEVRVVLDYIPPAGTVGRWVAKLFFEEPQQQVREDLRKFKQIMEAGEVPTIDGQPRGSCTGSLSRS